MEVLAVAKIDENYVIGNDNHIYRLPHIVNGKKYRMRRLKKVQKCFYYIYTQRIHEDDIESSVIETPYVLIKKSKINLK